jgi:hypothetical protein
MLKTLSTDEQPAALSRAVIQAMGEVERNDGMTVVVSTPDGLQHARLAVSCLVQPVCGDIVLVARHASELYVLAVLERHVDAKTEMRFARSVNMVVDGDLTLSATGRAAFAGGQEASIGAKKVSVSGDEVELTGRRISIVGQAFQWIADTLESTARLVKQVADVWTARARTHHRQVDEIEIVRAGHMDLRAEHVINVGSTHTIMKSRELTKIDGKQIQVG